MFKMNGTVIVQDVTLNIAKIIASAIDARTGKEESITIFVECTDDLERKEEVRMLAQPILAMMGYVYQSINDYQISYEKINAEKFWNEGLLK